MHRASRPDKPFSWDAASACRMRTGTASIGFVGPSNARPIPDHRAAGASRTYLPSVCNSSMKQDCCSMKPLFPTETHLGTPGLGTFCPSNIFRWTKNRFSLPLEVPTSTYRLCIKTGCIHETAFWPQKQDKQFAPVVELEASRVTFRKRRHLPLQCRQGWLATGVASTAGGEADSERQHQRAAGAV